MANNSDIKIKYQKDTIINGSIKDGSIVLNGFRQDYSPIIYNINEYEVDYAVLATNSSFIDNNRELIVIHTSKISKNNKLLLVIPIKTSNHASKNLSSNARKLTSKLFKNNYLVYKKIESVK